MVLSFPIKLIIIWGTTHKVINSLPAPSPSSWEVRAEYLAQLFYLAL